MINVKISLNKNYLALLVLNIAIKMIFIKLVTSELINKIKAISLLHKKNLFLIYNISLVKK